MNAGKDIAKLGCWVLLMALEIGGGITALPASAAPTYIAIPIGPSVGGTRGLAINASGQVAGASYFNSSAHHAFLFSGGVMQDLGTLGGAYSFGAGINDDGRVVGYSGTTDGSIHAFRHSGGTMKDLGTLGGDFSWAFGINNDGHVVGDSNTSDRYGRAFRYSGSMMQDLGTLGGQHANGRGINASGQVTGGSLTPDNNEIHAFRLSNGSMHDLGTLGGPFSVGLAINATGDVVGESRVDAGGSVRAFRHSGGAMQDLGTLGGPSYSSAQAINSTGDIVGAAETATRGQDHAFLYTGGIMYDLNSLVVSGLGAITLVMASAINDRGQILASNCGTLGAVKDCTSFRLDPIHNYGGIWWNAPAGSESGWGINFAHQGDVIFATWFTYDQAGKGWWLSMTAERTTDGVYSGKIYQTHGPAFSATPFSPADVVAIEIGTGTLTFADGNAGTYAYTVNGVSQVKSITRQMFGPMPVCVFGAQTNLALATNYQDLWWAAPAGVEGGWGVNFAHQGDIIFATWFTYDADGTPMWLSATANRTGPGVYAGTLYRTTGPAFDAVPFLPVNVNLTAKGPLTLTFANGNSATFAYTVSGVTQTKSIVRQVFRAPGTVCH